ncbi:MULTISPECIES: hypothetical protein [Streptomyces]|uniref:TetR family transcriptional regulator n=2 Tax=Streptomyces TaxID=1883 RepID=A0ABV9J7F0_9ACTN
MHDAVTALLLTAPAIRVLGPDALRISRQTLTAGVRVGITGMRPSVPDEQHAAAGEPPGGTGE